MLRHCQWSVLGLSTPGMIHSTSFHLYESGLKYTQSKVCVLAELYASKIEYCVTLLWYNPATCASWMSGLDTYDG